MKLRVTISLSFILYAVSHNVCADPGPWEELRTRYRKDPDKVIGAVVRRFNQSTLRMPASQKEALEMRNLLSSVSQYLLEAKESDGRVVSKQGGVRFNLKLDRFLARVKRLNVPEVHDIKVSIATILQESKPKTAIRLAQEALSGYESLPKNENHRQKSWAHFAIANATLVEGVAKNRIDDPKWKAKVVKAYDESIREGALGLGSSSSRKSLLPKSRLSSRQTARVLVETLPARSKDFAKRLEKINAIFGGLREPNRPVGLLSRSIQRAREQLKEDRNLYSEETKTSLLELMEKMMNRGDYEAVERLATIISVRDGKTLSVMALTYLGDSLHAQGKTEQAQKVYADVEEHVRRIPEYNFVAKNRFHYYEKRARFFQRIARSDLAEQAILKALEQAQKAAKEDLTWVRKVSQNLISLYQDIAKYAEEAANLDDPKKLDSVQVNRAIIALKHANLLEQRFPMAARSPSERREQSLMRLRKHQTKWGKCAELFGNRRGIPVVSLN